jgi:hypothetical protein
VAEAAVPEGQRVEQQVRREQLRLALPRVRQALLQEVVQQELLLPVRRQQARRLLEVVVEDNVEEAQVRDKL